MNGFVGMGMMNMQSGNVFGATTAAVANNVNYSQPDQAAAQQASQPVPPPAPAAPAPAPEGAWTCPECGATNTGKFCQGCGKSKEELLKPKTIKCPKCGAECPPTAKFCGECGQKLGE